MIPNAHITAWRTHAPWPDDAQVEQDLVLSRALCEIFSIPELTGAIAIRGGTVLHKLLIPGRHRYSEDLDLIWLQPGQSGFLLDALRNQLDPWLGTPQRNLSAHQIRLLYRFHSENLPVVRLRLKIEINTHETSCFLGFSHHPFEVQNPWFRGATQIQTYPLEELLGTKLRVLYQRKKGRDLFDLWLALEHTEVLPAQIIECFSSYMAQEGAHISGAIFQANLTEKLSDAAFREDIVPLLAANISYDPDMAGVCVRDRLLSLLP